MEWKSTHIGECTCARTHNCCSTKSNIYLFEHDQVVLLAFNRNFYVFNRFELEKCGDSESERGRETICKCTSRRPPLTVMGERISIEIRTVNEFVFFSLLFSLGVPFLE